MMSVHANTVKYRLSRVEALCGVSLRDPNDLVTVTLASLVVRLLADGDDLLPSRQSVVDSTSRLRRPPATVRPG
jgi:hypothetical protein